MEELDPSAFVVLYDKGRKIIATGKVVNDYINGIAYSFDADPTKTYTNPPLTGEEIIYISGTQSRKLSELKTDNQVSAFPDINADVIRPILPSIPVLALTSPIDGRFLLSPINGRFLLRGL